MPTDQVTDLVNRAQPLDALPLWVIYFITVFLLLLATEFGFRMGRYWQNKSPDEAEPNVGAMSGATMALLAFLIALVTSASISIFAARRQAVVAEANAIGTTYLRAGYLPEPIGPESQQLLVEYVDQRLAAVDVAQTVQAIVRSEEIQGELWDRAETLAREFPTPTSSLYIASLNEVIDLHTERINVALVVRVPWGLVFGLYLIAFLTLFLVGMHAGYREKRNLVAVVTFILTLSVVFYLIADLNRGSEGILKISQQSMLDLQRSINSN